MPRIIGLNCIGTLVWLATYSAALLAQPAAKLGTDDIDTQTSRVYIHVDKTGLAIPTASRGVCAAVR